MKPLFIIMAGDGINCERETAAAFEIAGASAKIVHINDLLEQPQILKSAEGIALPGGFSFGDELGSGQILALKIRHKLGDAFFNMVDQEKPIIGICNGFQALVKLGLLPYPKMEERIAALAPNEGGSFQDRWVALDVNRNSICHWTKDLPPVIELPIRHGEGRIVFKSGEEDRVYKQLMLQGQIPLTYAEDINGSYGRIAALTDPTGTVLGLMPHPEAFVSQATYRTPQREFTAGAGIRIFENIVRLLQGEKANEKRYA